MTFKNCIPIFGVNLGNVTYEEILAIIDDSIRNNKKNIIGYATAHSLNICYSNSDLKKIFNEFDLIHPDGIGVLLASKYLYGKCGFYQRITGSDFYLMLISEATRNKWKLFFFGDENEVLQKININGLSIVGKISGFNFNTTEVIQSINNSGTDILIVGLGCPLQEKWINDNKDKINAKIILAVGDGLKVFAGIRYRGPVFMQKLGLEWIIRLVKNPQRFWKRYIFGIPLFIYRIIKYKLQI
jgi:N-acetylglucosaminyldiphosphoundecaprenol N-acetyl-beta-D-mannosaminyltransferase